MEIDYENIVVELQDKIELHKNNERSLYQVICWACSAIGGVALYKYLMSSYDETHKED